MQKQSPLRHVLAKTLTGNKTSDITAGNKAVSDHTLAASDWSNDLPLLLASNAALETDDFSGSHNNLDQVCDAYE